MDGNINALAVVTLVSTVRKSEPFRLRNENDTYAHLSALCREVGINLYVAHFENALPGDLVLAWTIIDGQWQVVELPASAVSVAYADLPPNDVRSNELRAVLARSGVIFVNDLRVNDGLTDKVLTHQLLPDLVPPTLSAALPDLRDRLQREVASHADFRADKAILKPRYGERGKAVEVIEVAALESDRVRLLEDFIVQPLMDSDTGIPELGISGRHDLRMMVFNGEIKDFFVRVAPDDGFVCNQSHGGRIAYFELDRLPERFRAVARRVDQALRAYTPRYYSVDVGVGRSGKIWVYELNTMPGVVWNAAGTDKAQYLGMHALVVEAISMAAQRARRPLGGWRRPSLSAASADEGAAKALR